MKYLLGTVLLTALITGCASTAPKSSADKPLVQAQNRSYSFDHITDIPNDIAGPGFEMPVMIGGMAAFGKAVNKLAKQRPCPVRGRVSIVYVVDEQGNVIDSAVAEGIHETCDVVAADAIRVIKFEPARKNGEAVKIRLSTPVTFK